VLKFRSAVDMLLVTICAGRKGFIWRCGEAVRLLTAEAESVLWLQGKRDEKKSPTLPNLHRLPHTTNNKTNFNYQVY